MTKHRLILDVVDVQTAIEHFQTFEGVSAKPFTNLTVNRYTDSVVCTGPRDSLIKIAREHYDQEGDEFADAEVQPIKAK